MITKIRKQADVLSHAIQTNNSHIIFTEAIKCRDYIQETDKESRFFAYLKNVPPFRSYLSDFYYTTDAAYSGLDYLIRMENLKINNKNLFYQENERNKRLLKKAKNDLLKINVSYYKYFYLDKKIKIIIIKYSAIINMLLD